MTETPVVTISVTTHDNIIDAETGEKAQIAYVHQSNGDFVIRVEPNTNSLMTPVENSAEFALPGINAKFRIRNQKGITYIDILSV